MAKTLSRPEKLIKEGQTAFDKGDYRKAIAFHSRAIRLCRSNTRESKINLIDAWNGIGHALRSEGKFTKAKPFNEKALKLCRKLRRTDPTLDQKMVISMHYMADTLADLDKIDAAMKLSQDELKIARKLYSKDKKNLFYLVYGLNTVAARLCDKKRFSEAITIANESIREQKKSKNAETLKGYRNLSWGYHVLGVALLEKGDAEAAIKNLKEALRMRLIITDKNKRFIGATRNTLESLSRAYEAKAKSSAKSARGIL